MSSDIAIHITMQKEQGERLFKLFELMSLKPKRRFELQRQAAQEVRKYSTERVNRQETLSGAPMPKRSAKARKSQHRRKLLQILGRVSSMATYREGEGTVVSWKRSGENGHFANVAWPHQHGHEGTFQVNEKMLAALSKWHYRQSYRPLTPKMAQALLRNGYKKPVKTKGGKVKLRRTSAIKLRKNMTQLQGGWLLRMLAVGDVSKKDPKKAKQQSWPYKIPARAFLGVTPTEASAIFNKFAEIILRELDGV